MINRATGEGYVEFGNETDAGAALEYHKRNIGSRYVEVFKCPRAEMERVLNPVGLSSASNGSGVCLLSSQLNSIANLHSGRRD